jgi:hypothetical protein
MHPGIQTGPPTHSMNDPVLSCSFVMLNIEQAWGEGAFGLFASAANYPALALQSADQPQVEPKSVRK